MKKFITLIFIFFLSFCFAQNGSTNRFEESENMENTYTPNAPHEEPEVEQGPGNPGDPVPIDDYLPLLAVAAVGIIIYKTHQKKNLLS